MQKRIVYTVLQKCHEDSDDENPHFLQQKSNQKLNSNRFIFIYDNTLF